MVITPGIEDLEYEIKNGVKHFTLVAEEVDIEILPGIFAKGMGYNGCSPGPTIRVKPCDKVCIRVINNLKYKPSVHWHGLEVPNNMDGVPAVEPTPYINPGCYFDYCFEIINPPGTYMYHSHVGVVIQNNAGLLGGLIVEDPCNEDRQNYKDYLLLLQEWYLKGLKPCELKPGKYELDFMKHEFNFFTINGRCFPYDNPLPVSLGDTVRIRFGNIQMNHHPMHIHGHQFSVVGADGYPIKKENQIKKNTILVASGETWDIEFTANNPGIWPLHCHIPHHTSNNGCDKTGGMFTTIRYT